MTANALANCDHAAPNISHEFRGGSLTTSAAAAAAMGDVTLCVDFEAYGMTRQEPFAVGMSAHMPPLVPGGAPRRIDLVDTSKTATGVHTFFSTEADAVMNHYFKTADHFGNDLKRQRLQNTRDLAQNMSSEERRRFEADVRCCGGVCAGCGKPVGKLVPDHGHNEVTGDPVYIEPLCSPCNFKKRVSGKVSVLMFGGAHYDWILVQDAMSRCLPVCDCAQCEAQCGPRKWEIGNVLAKTPQNLLTFTTRTCREMYVPRCKAIHRNGERCCQEAMRGTPTCWQHKDSKLKRDESEATVAVTKPVGLDFKNLDLCKFVGPGSLEKKASELIPDSVELFRRKNGDEATLPPELVAELRATLPIVSSEFPNDELFLHATRKGVDAYELPGGFGAWKDSTTMPSIEDFGTSLNGPISADAYARVLRVHETLKACGLPTYGAYSDFYLKVDVLLTAEVAHNCQKTWWDLARIGIFNFVTLSGAAFAYMAKKTASSAEVVGDPRHTHPIELIDDPEIWEIFQQGRTGGFCAVGEARATANHPALKNFDVMTAEQIIAYIDESALYPATVSKNPMPGRDFVLIKDAQEIRAIVDSLHGRTVEDMRGDSTGHMLDVTIAYCCQAHSDHTPGCTDCQAVHDRNGVFPCVPQGRDVLWRDVSPVQRRMHPGCKDHNKYCATCDACDRPDDTVMSKRLVASLERKRVSISTISLAYYLARGELKVVEVHRAVSYTHTWCLKEFFEDLLEMRKLASTSGEKTLIKLIMNAIVGYPLMNKAGHFDVTIDTHDRTADELTKRRRVSTYVTDIKKGKLRYWLNRKKVVTETLPAQISIVTYDLSKLAVREHIDRVVDGMREGGFEVRKVYTDTDSMILHMIGDGVSEAWIEFNQANGDMFVHTNYPKWHDLYNSRNSKRFGTMEDERPPPARMGYCPPCQDLIRRCSRCDVHDRGGENPCSAPCEDHTTVACHQCNTLRETYRRVASIINRVVAAGSKNYLLEDEMETKVVSRGTMRPQRKRAAEAGAYITHYETGEGYSTKQPRLGATTIKAYGARQARERAADMDVTEPRIDMRVVGCSKKRIVIPEAGGEKAFMVEEACGAHTRFDKTCGRCRRFYRPFGHYLNARTDAHDL